MAIKIRKNTKRRTVPVYGARNGNMQGEGKGGEGRGGEKSDVLNNNSSSAPADPAAPNHAPGDEPYGHLRDHLSFLDEPAPRDDDLLLLHHRRSFSVPAIGAGGGPCLYYARGFCKNGSSCRFFHTDLPGSGGDLAGQLVSPRPSQLAEFDQCGELMKPRAAAAAAMSPKQYSFNVATANNNHSNASLPYNKCINFLLQHQNDVHPRSGSFGLNGLVNPSARQIYLTFPADSTFTEDDVSSYFSIYGPVQDVRIPYQQKRMFGFVTFLYPETVKLILAKGNPHFVCDSRVLVKPYKEKGKVVEKKQLPHQQLHLERGDYSISPCSSPGGVDSRDPFDVPFGGGRMYYSNQEMLLRKKLEEEADYNFRQALELQSQRLMNLQLQDLKNHQQHHHNHLHRHHQYHHNLPNGSSITSPTVPRSPNFQFPTRHQPDSTGRETAEADKASRELVETTNPQSNDNGAKNKEESSKLSVQSDNNESLEHILPDNLFASPKKSATDRPTMFTASRPEAGENPTSLDMPTLCSSSADCIFPTMSPALTVESSMNSVLLQLPRLSSSHGTIGM
ncbi:hypothetical protein CRG98_045766 [Punica granatum]|uniref:Zinc finger CCCH domain-containing protein 22-like n=1 Tax=Punica granatum TaxID=22663 RepID=A0A2I0HQ65_PUNGR|nr:hypothetical protein CRG98_045766 [Punica granatum]